MMNPSRNVSRLNQCHIKEAVLRTIPPERQDNIPHLDTKQL